MGNPWIVPRGQNWLITDNQAIASGTFVALVGDQVIILESILIQTIYSYYKVTHFITI